MNYFTIKINFRNLGFVIISFFSIVYSQIPDTIWTKTYGGVNYEFCLSMQITRDGGYVLGAETASRGAGGWDMWLIKTNNNGDTLWTRTYGGLRDDNCRSVLQTSDGGYLLSGSSRCFSNPPYYNDIYVIKTDSLGDTVWTRTYGGQVTDVSYGAQQTMDGGYIIAGSTWSYGPSSQNGYLIKLDSLGDTLWTKVYGGAYEDLFWAIQQTPDHGYIICGETASFGAGNFDAWLLKTDSLGDTLWTRTYGGESWDYGECCDQTAEGGYIISGATSSMGMGGADLWIIKTDANGYMQWQKTYGNTGNDYGRTIHQLNGRGYIVAGYQESPPGSGYSDAFIIRTDINGDRLWAKTYGYDSTYDEIYSLQMTPDAGYIAAGITTAYGAGLSDVWLLKIESDTYGVQEKPSPDLKMLSIDVYPNPFYDQVRINFRDRYQDIAEIAIYNVAGQTIKIFPRIEDNASINNTIYWDGRDDMGRKAPNGAYFLSLKTQNCRIVKKVIFLR